MTEAELKAIEAYISDEYFGDNSEWTDLVDTLRDRLEALCAEVRCLRGQVRRLRQQAAISDKPSIVHVKDAEHPPFDALTGAQVKENK